MVKIGVVLRYSKLDNGRDILFIGETIRRVIQKAGGFVIPIVQVQDVNYNSTRYNEFNELSDEEKSIIDKYLDMVDGVIFPGGSKITPYDKYLLKRCIELDKCVLGICLGMQLMSAIDIDFKVYENNSTINHNQDDDSLLSHKIKIRKGSKLYEIIGQEEIAVNSFHKYHVENLSSKYSSCAISEDGYIEGIEYNNSTFNIGVQWHPEISYDFDENSRKIINYFISECGKDK